MMYNKKDLALTVGYLLILLSIGLFIPYMIGAK